MFHGSFLSILSLPSYYVYVIATVGGNQSTPEKPPPNTMLTCANAVCLQGCIRDPVYVFQGPAL